MLVKERKGDLDARGRVRTRSMILHPRTSILLTIMGFALAAYGFFNQTHFGYLAFGGMSLTMLAMADLASTWGWSSLYLAGTVFSLALTVLTYITTP